MKFVVLRSAETEIEVCNLGARLTRWNVKVAGQERAIILRYSTPQAICDDAFYVGAVAGPYANRIKKGRVGSGNKSIQLAINDGENHLHGGPNALDKHLWEILSHDASHVKMSCETADGWNGYPGPMQFVIEYRLEGNSLTLVCEVKASKNTIAGMTGHSYFNLNGIDSGKSGLAQWVRSNATHLTEKFDDGLPSGTQTHTQESAFDFRQLTLLKALEQAGTLDHNFVYDAEPQETELWSESRDLGMRVSSNYPAAQLYTGGFLSGTFVPHQGVCIEPHFGADAPNAKGNPQGLLASGERSHYEIRYEVIIPG